MRAVWYERGGPAAEVLQTGTMDVPEPGAGEVRVRIAWSAVNPHDVKKRIDGRETGTWGRIVPHSDGSGAIDQVGVGVPAQRIGEQVWLFGAQVGQANGTCAEYCVVPAWKAVRLPEQVSLREGACLGIPAVTAVQALSVSGPLQRKTVLVQGGAGRVGAYAVQFASQSGARVTATASKDDCAVVEQLGAERCFDYSDPELVTMLLDARGKHGFDLIVESRFGSHAELDARVVSRNGVIAAYGFDDDRSPAIPATLLVMKNAACHFIGIFALGRKIQETVLERVCQLIGQHRLQYRVGLQVELADTATAHQRIEAGRVPGAALIQI